MEYDLVIRNGTVVDGTRLPRFRADVGIKHGRVGKIGRIGRVTAARELDATGCIVAPGFVDLHTHYDAQIHWDPYCTISGWHGVTSLVLGNCGFGFAPVKPADRERSLLMMTRTEQIPYQTMKEGMQWRWETLPEWLDDLDRLPKGVNLVSYVPVSPLMVYVMGLEAAKSRPATSGERMEMQRLLNEAMDAGACGFSIQRLGKHSLQADVDGTPMPTDCMADEDILALAEVLRERDEGFIQITPTSGAATALFSSAWRKSRSARSSTTSSLPSTTAPSSAKANSRGYVTAMRAAFGSTDKDSMCGPGSTSRSNTGTSTTPAPPGIRRPKDQWKKSLAGSAIRKRGPACAMNTRCLSPSVMVPFPRI